MAQRRDRDLTRIVLVWDVTLTLLALRSTPTLRLWFHYGNAITGQQVQIPWQLYWVAACIWTVVFLLLRPHSAFVSDSLVEAAGRLLAAVALAVVAFAGVLYLSLRDISRLQFLFFAVIDLIALLVFHVGVHFYLRGRYPYGRQRRTLIVGSGAQAQQLVQELASRPWVGIYVVGCTGDKPLENSALPVLGPIDQTARIVAEERVEEVIFAISHEDAITRLSLQLRQQPVMLHKLPSALDLAFARTPVETFNGIHLISLKESALTDSQLLLKRLFDLLGSGLLLIICSPLLLAVAIAIKLESPGSVFFCQQRIGAHGRRFKMIKFRTMCQDAEQRWSEVSRRQSSGHIVHKRDDDPRVTRVGRKLRRSSLDELPQLINVLRGEMSLVGPRPELPKIVAEYAPWQWQRFRVPAGMTGWWQVNGRSAKPMHLHTEDDLYYIQNYSFWLDLKILWMTIPTVLKGQGAF